MFYYADMLENVPVRIVKTTRSKLKSYQGCSGLPAAGDAQVRQIRGFIRSNFVVPPKKVSFIVLSFSNNSRDEEEEKVEVHYVFK